jgi:hypothetical protein
VLDHDTDTPWYESLLATGWLIWIGILSLLVVFVLGAVAISMNRSLDDMSVQQEQQSERRERLYSQVITDRWTSLQQTLGDIADLQTQLDTFPMLYGENTAVWPQGKTTEYQQLQQQLTNRRSAYRQQCAAYEAMWLDDWRAEVAPDGVPKQCPALE